MKPKISVIVPIYNVEDYLGWCLDSLVAQDMPDFEAVLVNDGSPDGSRDVAKTYCDRDTRFVLVDKENGGLSSARNAGIQAASAPLVAFLDSDDRFTPDACGVICRAFEASDADVVTFGANPYPDGAGYPWLNYVLSPRDVTYAGYSSDLLFKEASRPFAWRTACKRDFLLNNKIAFDESVKYGEDQVFDFAIYGRSSKTALISNKLYDYRVARKGSLMDTMRQDDETRLLEHVKIFKAIVDDWSRDGLEAEHPEDLDYFLCDLVLYDALRLLRAQSTRIFSAVGKVLDGSSLWTSEVQSKLHPSVAAMIELALSKAPVSKKACTKTMFAYDVMRFGRAGALKRLAANAMGKREV